MDRPVTVGVAGQRVGINLHRVPLAAVERGMALTAPEALAPGYLLNVEMEVLAHSDRPLRDRQRVKHCRLAAYLHALVRYDVEAYLDARLDAQSLRPLTARELARDTFTWTRSALPFAGATSGSCAPRGDARPRTLAGCPAPRLPGQHLPQHLHAPLDGGGVHPRCKLAH